MCASANCDQGGHTWWSTCTGNTCECEYDDQLICTCEIAGGFCNTQPTCCPSPPWAP